MNINGLGGTSYSGSTVGSTSAAMGKQDFMNLLVAQLANQDPLNPMDNQQFAAQLAQFSSLEQMANMQATLEEGLALDRSLAGAFQGNMAAGLIGRQVTALDDRIVLDGNGALLRWEAEEAPDSVTVTITNEVGATVHQQVIADPGEESWQWDGRNAAGQSLPDGTYHVALSAKDADGAAVAIRPLWMGVVETVRFREGVALLVSSGLEFGLDQVSEVAKGSAEDLDDLWGRNDQ